MNFDKLTEYLHSLDSAYSIPGLDLKVVQNHKTVYRLMTGYADHDKKAPITADNLYDIYSATKVVTMTAVMQLVERNLISLDDDICKYFPEFAYTRVLENYNVSAFPFEKPDWSGPSHIHRNPIKLRNLMSMTAGMSYEVDAPEITECVKHSGRKAGTVELVRAMASTPLIYEPGTRYRYSFGHDVMAAVVEIVSGERFSDYIMNHIFTPLGVDDVYMHPGKTEEPRLVEKWRLDVDTGIIRPYKQENDFRLSDEYDSGGAGMTCTTDAYMKFMDALACGGIGENGARILTPESIQLMATRQLNDQEQEDFGRGWLGYSYGLGVRTLIDPTKAKSPVGEFGWDGAAGAFCLADVKNRISLFYTQEVLSMRRVYFEVHPAIRDLVYEALEL